MSLISSLRVSLRKVAYPDQLRSFYDVEWQDVKGGIKVISTQNFYEMTELVKQLTLLMDNDPVDPRDEEFMRTY
jgi:hypothetical protein